MAGQDQDSEVRADDDEEHEHDEHVSRVAQGLQEYRSGDADTLGPHSDEDRPQERRQGKQHVEL